MSLKAEGQRSDSTSGSLKQRFRKAALRMRDLGSLGQYNILPFTSPKLPWFSALSVEKQQWAVETLERSCEIYAGVPKKDFRSPSAVVWAAFRHLGLVPPADFFDKIHHEYAIQVFSLDHVHMFANFRFFELCSYTLEEVYSRPWNDLWERSDEDLRATFALVNELIDSADRKTRVVHHIHQILRERSSVLRFEYDYKLKAIAPLWDKKAGAMAAYIALEDPVIINRRDSETESRILQECARQLEIEMSEGDFDSE